MVGYYDSPLEFDCLSLEEQEILLDWLNNSLLTTIVINYDRTTLDLAKCFQYSPRGFEITHGMIKGAILHTKYIIADKKNNVWHINISEKSPGLFPIKFNNI